MRDLIDFLKENKKAAKILIATHAIACGIGIGIAAGIAIAVK